jgi:hypothetical protein
MRSIVPLLALLLISCVPVHAGGPAFVAGSGYNPGVEGQPLLWANGSVTYYTDQGNLSVILSGAQADALVATAFGAWTTVPGVALTATQAGHLAEDVNGSNIQANLEGVVSAPADIMSSATNTPVGIVYDIDGSVTDAMLGEGAGDLQDCFTNAVYGGPDNFSAAGNIVHALVVINGVCANTAAQLPDVQYRLVRVLGRVLGLGWSQANLNVLTQKPPPSDADFAGFPLMHFLDSIACVPISVCYPDAATPKMDDSVAMARLYPASADPQPSGRVFGSVYFTDASGNAGQPMQGVNVVARLMVSGQPSRQYVTTSVSGFLFCGNAGNIIDGYVDGNGLPYNRWGSGDSALEGFFDLGQLPIPSGQTTAQYQLSVEALDPRWSRGLQPYAPTQVSPSGAFAPVVVTVSNGSNGERDILMLQAEIAQTHPGSGSTYANPAVLPQGGAWGSWISGYGSTDFFQFTAQGNRTATVSVIALDEAGQPTETKLSPVIGIWELSDESGNPAPAATSSAFNSTTFGMTRLDAQFSSSEKFRLGVADFRGDGRPDYFYQAKLLYSDSVTPARLGLLGGVTTLHGIGFSPALQVNVGGNQGSTLSASASQLQVLLPAGLQDGTATLQVTDPVSGAFSQMIGALTYGASATDQLLLLQGVEPATPVGAAAPNPIRVRAVAADGVTPVSGATIGWNSNNGVQLSACGGAASCSVLSDEAGEAASWITPSVIGQSTITIALAPASYSPPQSQQATVVGTTSTLDLAALAPTRWVAQGATVTVPLMVEALDLGVPLPNVTVNYMLTGGNAALSASSATTAGTGFAGITATLANLNATVQVVACVAPNNSPCQTFTLFATPASTWTLETVRGSSQVVPSGQAFQPLSMRVTDGSSAANPVLGAYVTFATTLARVNPNGTSVILGSSQTQVATAQDGTASMIPSAGSVGPCTVFITASAGQSTVQLQMEVVAAIITEQPVKIPHQTPATSWFPQFGVQLPALPEVPQEFYAVPEAMPSPEPPPTDCSGTSQSAACATLSDSAESGAPEITLQAAAPEDKFGDLRNSPSNSPGDPAHSPVDVPAPKPVPSAPVAEARLKVDTPVPAPKSDAASLIEDKRSCRFAQMDTLFVW